MKKNFFKKLSFVLALAMIVTALAPAAGVFAASAPKLNAKSKYLMLGVDGQDEFDFNVANKKKGWTYKWTTANADVATVNAKNGVVTATGVGTTKISVVIKDKDKEKVDTLKATVTVRDNIKTLTITGTPAGNKLAVGATNDFNRSFTTVSGSTKKTSGVTRWSVSPATGATINDSGVFTATAAGEYTITANAFQSKAKYASWLADSTKYASYVTATATYKVTVAASMTKVEQVDVNTFKVTFDSAVSDAATKLSSVYLAGTAKINAPIKKVEMSADNKVATVDMHVDFVTGSTYVVSYPNMTDVQFVAATTKVADVVDMAITTTTAEKAKKKTIDIALYNKDKVNIATPELLARVTCASSNSVATINGSRDLYMYNVGNTTTITATFHTYNWDAGKEVGNLVATATITCVEQSTEAAGVIEAYTIAAGAGAFQDVKHTIAKGDTGLFLWVKTKGKDSDGNDKYFTNETNVGLWKYTSSNQNVVMVGPNNALWAANEGTATVVISYNDKQVGAVEINVTAPRKVARVELGTTALAASNADLQALVAGAQGDTRKVSVKVTDQLTSDYGDYKITVEPNVTSTDATALLANPNAKVTELTINPYGVKAGTYYYTVTAIDTKDGNFKAWSNITIEVKELPVNASVSYYQVETDKTTYDMKVTDNLTDGLVEKVSLSLYGYTSNNVRMTKENINSLGTGLVVKDTNGATVATVAAANGIDAEINLVPTTTTTVSGTVYTHVDPKLIGNWTVTATSGSPLNAISFEVKNSQATYSVSLNKTHSTKTTIVEAINDCFDFTKKGVTSEVSSIAYVDMAGDTGKAVQVNYVYFYELIQGTTYVKHKVKVDKVIYYAQ